MRAILVAYKRLVSPLLMPACRFVPTCSEYSRQAYADRGFVRGSWLTAHRLVRCHPWCEGGHDPLTPSVCDRDDHAPAAHTGRGGLA